MVDVGMLVFASFLCVYQCLCVCMCTEKTNTSPKVHQVMFSLASLAAYQHRASQGASDGAWNDNAARIVSVFFVASRTHIFPSTGDNAGEGLACPPAPLPPPMSLPLSATLPLPSPCLCLCPCSCPSFALPSHGVLLRGISAAEGRSMHFLCWAAAPDCFSLPAAFSWHYCDCFAMSAW